MATMAEIRRATEVVAAALPDPALLPQRLALLHCVSLYPTAPTQANLRAIPHLAQALGLTTGYSDHTMGLAASTAALALGARIIEKHFTLNKAQSAFRDHALSAEPAEMKQLAELVHSIDDMLGSGERDSLPDQATRQLVRRSIVAMRPLPAGTVLQAADLDCIRPANGLPPQQASALIGRRLRAAVDRHHVFQLQDVD
jgi:N,N'-diacetyllegionaminate synthase